MATRLFDVRDPSGSWRAVLADAGVADLPPVPGPRGRVVRTARAGVHGR